MFLIVICLPIMIVGAVLILVQFIKYQIYRMKHKEEQTDTERDGSPILILKYNNRHRRVLLLVAAIFLMCVLLKCFFIADYTARDDLNILFFSLDEHQTYILYYWAWKLGTVALFIICLQGYLSKLFFKRIVFYKNAIVLENSALGNRVLELNDNVRRAKSATEEWLYDDRKGISIRVFSKKLMTLNPDEEKVLQSIISKIPENMKLLLVCT